MTPLVSAAVARIDEGALDERSVDALARELRVTARHLRRAVHDELGLSPIQLAQTKRLALARQLVEESALPITEIAFASGFRSIRRFNALFRAAYGAPPTRFRTTRVAPTESLALRFESPAARDWNATLRRLARRAIPHVELVRDGVYSRTVRIGKYAGWIAVYPLVNHPILIAEVSLSLVRALVPVLARLRRMFNDGVPFDESEAQWEGARASRPPTVGGRGRPRSKDAGGMTMPKPQRFRAEILMGHKGAAVIVPFDPTAVWKTKPVQVGFRRLGHLVRGTINGHAFEGWIGYRWGRYFIMVDDELQRAAGAAVGETVEMMVEPRKDE